MNNEEEKVVKLTIENRTIVRVMAVGVAFILGLELLNALEIIIRLIIMATFLAVALNPPVNFLTNKMTFGGRALASAISYVFVILILGIFLIIVIPPFARETANFIDEFPNYVDDIRTGDGIISDVVRNLNLDEELEDISNNVSDVIGSANSVLLNGISAVGTFIFQLVTVLVLAFFMLIEGPTWIKDFWETQSLERRKRYEPLLKRVYGIITGYVNGQLLIAFIAAVASLVAMLIAGIPYPLPLATLVGMFGLIPLVGATLGAIVVVAFSLFQSLYAAGFMAIFFLIYQQIENNGIQPYVQSKNLDVSPLLVLTAVLTGATLGGLIGGFIAIPVAASLKVFFLDYRDRRVAKNKPKA
jgi:predicted PurR-regulated permease PerM